MISNPYIVGQSPASDVLSNAPDDSIMSTNITIVCLAGSARMGIIPIPIVGNAFTLIPTHSLCIVISGLVSTTCIRLFTRQYCIPGIRFQLVVIIQRWEMRVDAPNPLLAW